MVSRRTFLGWLSGLGAALGLAKRGRFAYAAAETTQQTGALDPVSLTAVAAAVLPGELGNGGFARVAREFTQWIEGYRPGAEIVHPYGSADIRTTGPSPVGRWRSQLGALDQQARQQHRAAFSALTVAQRRALVTAAIDADRPTRLPDPIAANHVGLALVAWYFASPDAVDRCYNARIGRNQCRPLVNAPRQPLPLASNARAPQSGIDS